MEERTQCETEDRPVGFARFLLSQPVVGGSPRCAPLPSLRRAEMPCDRSVPDTYLVCAPRAQRDQRSGQRRRPGRWA